MSIKQYDIVLNYDTKKAEASLGAFRDNVVRQFSELSARTAKIEVLKDLEQDAKKANDAVVKLKDESDRLNGILAKLGKGDTGFKQLSAEVTSVDKALRAAEKSAGAYADKMRVLDTELRSAGVDTKNLAAEQLLLAKALEAAQRAAAAQSARQTLGVVSTEEARGQIAKLTEAYTVLRESGVASVNELAKAKQNLTQRTIELNAEQSLFNGQLRQIGVAMVGLVSSVAAYTAGLRSAVGAASQYEQGLASIASITTLNKRQLDELGAGVLQLAGRIGVNAVEAFRALYNIIGSGIPAENSLSVLEASSKAAVAGLTSIENAARISVQVLNAYQLQIGQIDKVHDILFQTVRDGVISFEELSDKFGVVLPAARTAGVSLEELSAATVVLTRNGLSAPRAMVALEGAIKQLAAPSTEAAAAMAELNITYNGFTGTIEQLSRLSLGPDLIRRLIPDVEGQRAIALLTGQVGLFRSSLIEANNAAGATAEAFNKLKDTPEQAYKRFTAEVNNLQVASGKALLEGIIPMLNGVTSLIKSYNELPGAVRGSLAVITAIGGALGVSAIAARTLTPLLLPLAAGLAEIGAAGVIAAGGVNAARVAITNFLPAIVGGALGYEFGKSWRENNAIIRNFGDSLGSAIGYIKENTSALIDYAAAASKRDVKGMADAVAALSRNEAQYLEVMKESSLALSDLEIKQKKLRDALEESQKAVGTAGAKFRDAFTEIIEAVDAPLATINARISNNARQIEAAIGRISASAIGLKEVFTAQSADIDRALAEQTQAVELLVSKRELTEVESIKRLSDVNAKANADRLKSLNEFSESAKKAFEAEASSRVALAAKTGADVKKLEIEIANSRIALINDLSAKYSAYIAAAQKAEEGLRDKIKSVDDQIRKIRADQADFQNRAIAASSGDVLAYYDRQSRAEAALAAAQRTTGEERQQYLERAKTLATSLGQAVSDTSGREIEAGRAASIASGIFKRATDLEIAALNEKKTVFAASAEQFAAAGVAAKGSFVDIKAQLDRLFPEATKKLTLAIETDKAQIDGKIADLQRDLLLQAPLLNVKLSVDTALADYETFKAAVERNKPIAEVEGKFDAFKDSYRDVITSLPLVELTPDTKKVDDALTGLAGKVAAFKVNKLELQSNVDEIAGKVKALNDQVLATKQLTIEVNYTFPNGKPDLSVSTSTQSGGGGSGAGLLPGFARGGYVRPSVAAADRLGLATQRFASGGSVSGGMLPPRHFANGGPVFPAPPRFNRPSDLPGFAKGGFVGRVPGVGNTDSFLTYLQNGSFVLRKRAVESLTSGAGELRKSAVASLTSGSGEVPKMAYGGFVRPIVPQYRPPADGGSNIDKIEALITQIQGANLFQRGDLIANLDRLAIEERVRNVAAYRSTRPAGYISANAEQVIGAEAAQKTRAAENAYGFAVKQQDFAGAKASSAAAIEQVGALTRPLVDGDFAADDASQSGRSRFSSVEASGGTNYSLDGFIAAVSAAPVFDRTSQMNAMFVKAQDLQNRSIAELRTTFPAGYIEGGAERISQDRNKVSFQKILAAYVTARSTQSESGANAATTAAIDYANVIARPVRALTLEDVQGLAARKVTGGGVYLADGGPVNDGILAYTMPGEHVFSPEQVKSVGLLRLEALNAMRFANGGPVGMLSTMSAGLPDHAHAMFDRLARFNLGGEVSNSTSSNSTTNITIPAININAGSSVNERQLSRALFDQIGEISRKRK